MESNSNLKVWVGNWLGLWLVGVGMAGLGRLSLWVAAAVGVLSCCSFDTWLCLSPEVAVLAIKLPPHVVKGSAVGPVDWPFFNRRAR